MTLRVILPDAVHAEGSTEYCSQLPYGVTLASDIGTLRGALVCNEPKRVSNFPMHQSVLEATNAPRKTDIAWESSNFLQLRLRIYSNGSRRACEEACKSSA